MAALGSPRSSKKGAATGGWPRSSCAARQPGTRGGHREQLIGRAVLTCQRAPCLACLWSCAGFVRVQGIGRWHGDSGVCSTRERCQGGDIVSARSWAGRGGVSSILVWRAAVRPDGAGARAKAGISCSGVRAVHAPAPWPCRSSAGVVGALREWRAVRCWGEGRGSRPQQDCL